MIKMIFNIVIAAMIAAIFTLSIIGIVKDAKSIRAIKSRRQLLEEIYVFLNNERVLHKNNLTSYDDLIDKFWHKFVNDMW